MRTATHNRNILSALSGWVTIITSALITTTALMGFRYAMFLIAD